MTDADLDRLVTVCAACKQASCWQAKFMCQQSDHANIERLPVRQLRVLGLEHPDYWDPECEAGRR